MKGNLGDVLQLSVLLSALRMLKPERLDLAGYPPRPAPAAEELVARVDRYLSDPFPRYWVFTPAPLARRVVEPPWRRRRAALFRSYDAVVCAPGPYLADYDARAPSALCDIRVAGDLGLPVALASHSVGPLSPDGVATVARATVRVAREAATFAYLRDHDITSVRAADLAFLYPFERAIDGSTESVVRGPYYVVFIRSNNLRGRALSVRDGRLYHGERLIADAGGASMVLATSDAGRDERFLTAVARRLSLPVVVCRTPASLARLVAGSVGVASDRYHPAICAVVLGKPVLVVANREPHKTEGLRSLLSEHGVPALQDLARTGLDALCGALQRAS
jgi:polysaccharide pyruvyl transferase WcaK-like protein